MSATPATSRGRPRSDTARAAVLAAALALQERHGWPGVTIEGIAAEAGVGKATIYRWWPSKAAVLMDALVEASDTEADFPDTGEALEDMRLQLRRIIRLFTKTAAGRALLALVAESQHDPEVATALRERLIAARRAGAREVLVRGIDRGELRADLDPDVAIDAIYGALYYRLLVSHERTTQAYAEKLLAQLRPALVAA